MDFSHLSQVSFVVQLHLFTALLALCLGSYMWAAKKGTASHKRVGKLFVALMLITAFSAIFIRYNDGKFSFIHLFVPLTFVGALQAVYYVRNKNIKKHISAVKGLYFGALIIPGLFAFMPGRLMSQIFFG